MDEGRKSHYHCTNESDKVVFENFSLHPCKFSVSYFIPFLPPLLL